MFRARFICALVVALASAATPHARAITVAESGDAGDLPGTAQNVGAGVDRITGTTAVGGDVDMFRLVFSNGGTIGFETRSFYSDGSGVLGSGKLGDPNLFLFNAAGNPLAGNDDLGFSGDAGIPGGYFFDSGFSLVLAPGTYYVAIGANNLSGLDVSSAVIVDNDFGVQDPTGVLGAWGFGNNSEFGGTYEILITQPTDGEATADGTAIPEPATAGLGLLALGGLGSALLRRRA